MFEKKHKHNTFFCISKNFYILLYLLKKINDITVRFIAVYEKLQGLGFVLSKADFAQKIGVSNSMLSEIYKRRTNAGIKAIQNTVLTFPNINPDWLLTGQGQMMTSPTPDAPVHQVSDVAADYHVQRNNMPLIPLHTFASWGKDNPTNHKAEGYWVPDFNELQADFLVRAKDGAMQPHHNSGDLLACKMLPISTFIQYNRVHLVDTLQGVLIKRLKHGEKVTHITCVSDHPDFGPFELPRKEISAMALVVGVIRLE
jgi:repressor LexA